MLERPYHAINHELLVLWRDLEQSAEAVRVDRLQETEELQSVFREVLANQLQTGGRGDRLDRGGEAAGGKHLLLQLFTLKH